VTLKVIQRLCFPSLGYWTFCAEAIKRMEASQMVEKHTIHRKLISSKMDS